MGSFLVALLRRRRGTSTSTSCDVTVTFHTPYAATFFLDEKKLTALTADDLRVVARDLNQAVGPVVWEPVEEDELGLQGYEPEVTAELERQMPRRLLRATPRCASPDAPLDDGFTWRREPEELVVWNLGAALVTTRYAVAVPDGQTWEDLATRAADRKIGLSHRTAPWVSAALSNFAEMAASKGWLNEWSDPPEAEELWGGPMWTFYWFSVLTPRDWPTSRVRSVAAALIPDCEDCALPGLEQSSIRIGLSACCVSRRHEAADHHDRLRAHVASHTVGWGAGLRLSAHVWEKLVKLKFKTPLWKRDPEGQKLPELADKVAFFLSTVEGVTPHLDVPDAALWKCLDEGWKFPDVRATLQKRLDALRGLQKEKSDRRSNVRLALLNVLAILLSVVSLVSLVYGPTEVRKWLCDRGVPLGCSATEQVDQEEPSCAGVCRSP